MKTEHVCRRFGLPLFLALIGACAANAATVTDCNEASLRGAIAGGGTVTFACDGVIALTSPVEITNAVVLDATGRDVAISGIESSRVFLVGSSGNLTLVGLSIVNGFHSGEGAGILNLGVLAIQRCVLSNNASFRPPSGGSGGAIANRGVLDVSETTFVTNRVYFEGGAIYNAGSLQVNRCTFIGNTASFGGGAISSRTSPQLPPTGITNCTFYGNTGRASDIYNAQVAAPPAGLVNAVNCTFSTGSGVSIGGVAASAIRVWVANSIVRGSADFFIDGGNNLLESTPDNLHLGPLANNGGPTLTRELLPDSPAIDQGNNEVCPPVDQRGVARPIRARCDIGALETSTSPTPDTIQFASSTFSVTEGATNAKLSVLRLGNSGGSATVNFSMTSGSATSGQDFLPTSGTLTFAGGQTQADIVVPILNDFAPEPSETLTVNLDSPGGNASLGSPTSAVLTIEDDDPVQPGTIQFLHASYGVAEGSGHALVVVNRVGGTNGLVSVNVTASDGTAVAGQDYVLPNGTLTFGDTETRKTFTVELIDDLGNDGLETFSLTLSNPGGGATIGIPSTTTITIADRAQTLSNCDETSLRAAVGAGGTVQFTCDGTITLTSPLVVSSGTFLNANGHNVTISGGNAVRPFVLQPGVTLALQNLTVADGLAMGTNGNTSQPGGPGERRRDLQQ